LPSISLNEKVAHAEVSRQAKSAARDVFIGLTRIKLQRAIHFYLQRGSLPENTAKGQP